MDYLSERAVPIRIELHGSLQPFSKFNSYFLLIKRISFVFHSVLTKKKKTLMPKFRILYYAAI